MVKIESILLEPTPQLYLRSLPIWLGLASSVCPAPDLDEACNILGDILKVSQGFPSWTPRRPWHWVWTSSCKKVKIESWDVWGEELRADLQWRDLGKYLCNLLANGEMSDCSPCGPSWPQHVQCVALNLKCGNSSSPWRAWDVRSTEVTWPGTSCRNIEMRCCISHQERVTRPGVSWWYSQMRGSSQDLDETTWLLADWDLGRNPLW